MKRLLNVSPGPTALPNKVFKKIQSDMSNKFINGKSPLEISHRSDEFKYLLKNIKHKISHFMNIPSNYSILFTQAGASAQFSSIINNLHYCNKVLYIISGLWSKKAYNETKKYSINSNSINIYDYYINKKDTQLYDYIYFCDNETIDGIQLNLYPERTHDDCLIVSDMSSSFGQKLINWNNFDIVFASTSKNMGIAGTNILIMNNNVIDKLNKVNNIPSVLDWKLYYETQSLYNTPSVFNFYVLDTILDYYIDIGTISDFDKLTMKKGEMIYNILDKHEFIEAIVESKSLRSNINIPFKIKNNDVDKFLNYCERNNIIGVNTDIPFNNQSQQLRFNLYNHLSLKDTENLSTIINNYK
jgi:phosphoserine aminotransferase|tara:strand:+ start:207 stop:1277 length:1071 start_codon:yes stop_codon:yes gene_type:complete